MTPTILSDIILSPCRPLPGFASLREEGEKGRKIVNYCYLEIHVK